MNKIATITVRLDPQVKRNAEAIFKTLGLTTSQAVNLFFYPGQFTKRHSF